LREEKSDINILSAARTRMGVMEASWKSKKGEGGFGAVAGTGGKYWGSLRQERIGPLSGVRVHCLDGVIVLFFSKKKRNLKEDGGGEQGSVPKKANYLGGRQEELKGLPLHNKGWEGEKQTHL